MTVTKKEKEIVFDRNQPRAVCMKVRCSGPQHNNYGYELNNYEKCGTVYLRIVSNEDNPTPMDLRTTHTKCPTCGSEKFENLTDWTLGRDGIRVVVHSKDPL